MDGKSDHLKDYVILRIGTAACSHHYHDVAIGITSAGEGQEQVFKFLSSVDAFIRKTFPSSDGLVAEKMMVDGSSDCTRRSKVLETFGWDAKGNHSLASMSQQNI